MAKRYEDGLVALAKAGATAEINEIMKRLEDLGYFVSHGKFPSKRGSVGRKKRRPRKRRNVEEKTAVQEVKKKPKQKRRMTPKWRASIKRMHAGRDRANRKARRKRS